MAKATKKRPTGKSMKTGPRPASKKGQPTRKASSQAEPRSNTKQSSAIALLRSTKGASIAALMETTGWQQHSVRGFLAGVVRKRLGLEVEYKKVDGCRVYRITGERNAQHNSTGSAE
jgi:hypothetical protein